MSEAGRRALWEREKNEPKVPQTRRPLRSRPAKKQQQQPRPVAPPRASRGYWRVVRVNDDGRQVDVAGGLAYEDADRIAGERRDRSTDAELLEGWNYLPMKLATPKGGAHSLPFEAKRR